MARRRTKAEILEDTFADLSIEEQRLVLPVLQGLHRQKARGGVALQDIAREGRDKPLKVDLDVVKRVEGHNQAALDLKGGAQ